MKVTVPLPAVKVPLLVKAPANVSIPPLVALKETDPLLIASEVTANLPDDPVELKVNEPPVLIVIAPTATPD